MTMTDAPSEYGASGSLSGPRRTHVLQRDREDGIVLQRDRVRGAIDGHLAGQRCLAFPDHGRIKAELDHGERVVVGLTLRRFPGTVETAEAAVRGEHDPDTAIRLRHAMGVAQRVSDAFRTPQIADALGGLQRRGERSSGGAW